MAPSIASQVQSMPLKASYSARPACQKRKKKPSSTQGLEAVVRRGAWAEARRRKRVPLAAGSQDKEDAIRALTIRHAGPPATEAVGVRMRSQERLHQGPKLIADDELSARALGCVWRGAPGAWL